MTLRFAASPAAAAALPIARVLAWREPAGAANDNGREEHDRLLHAALRHFAEHGMGAARDSYRRAERAFFAGDRASYQWWLGVCRTLDRRMAETAERRCQL